MKWIVFPLFFAAAAAGAEDSAVSPAKVAQTLDSLQAAENVQVAKVAAAITAAAKAGQLKPETEAYFRDCLSHFETGPSGLSEAERAYFPPRFDTSPQMEPINLAWAELRTEVSREQKEKGVLALQLYTAATDALDQAARTAERAADLAPLQQAADQWSKLIDPLHPRFGALNDPFDPDLLSRYRATVKLMGEALEARAGNDLARLGEALKQLLQGQVVNLRDSRINAAAEYFRLHLSEPYQKQAADDQARLEEALLARRPASELDGLISAYDAALKVLPIFRPPNQSYNSSDGGTLRVYQTAARAVTSLASPDRPARIEASSLLASGQEVPLIHPVLFRQFMDRLSAEIEERNRLGNGELRPPVPGDEAPRDQAPWRARVREKLAAIDSPEAALALVDALPGMMAVGSGASSAQSAQERSVLQPLTSNLQQIAEMWQTGNLQSLRAQAPRGGGWGESFARELHQLTERAVRDVLAKMQDLPELQKPPFSEEPLNLALKRIADAAAERSEWKKVLPALQQMAAEGAPSVASRAVAVQSFLSATNFEQAEDFAKAAEFYAQVLIQSEDHTPIKESIARLKAIRAEHPEAVAGLHPEAGRPFPFVP